MKNKICKLPIILEPQPEGGYTVTCPLIPNLITEVDRLEELTDNISDALDALIEGYQDLGQPLPEILRPQPLEYPVWAETLIPVAVAE
ncbi:antitoxin HicB [Candidatus Magnetomoraceae bacterium gMMP-15]